MPLYAAILMLLGILLTSVLAFGYLFKVKNLISYHLGMNIAMTSAGTGGLAIGAVLGAWLYNYSTLAVVAATLLAIAIGAVFGSLVDYQTVVTGITSGVMSGLMGPMLGMHMQDPILIAAFCTLAACLSFVLLCVSVRA
ncbi:hypothetical protein [Paenibacillus tarimensis]